MSRSQHFAVRALLVTELVINNVIADICIDSFFFYNLKRRCGIFVSLTGPGPAYGLRTAVGTADHCPTKTKAPAYTIGRKYNSMYRPITVFVVQGDPFIFSTEEEDE